MQDENKQIIYVGKALNLRNRVKQYFQKTDKIKRIQILVSNIQDFEYIVTDTEDEALILEANLIKKHMPKYNVLLKDDKAYPYIKLDVKSDFPTLSIARKVKNDGSKYYGPYSNARFPRDLIEVLKKIFKIRVCRPFKIRKRPCINFQMNLCDAPCIGNISKEEYDEKIIEIEKILSGNYKPIIEYLEKRMKDESKALNYEEALEIREQINRITGYRQKQKISNFNYKNIDAIGMASNELTTVIEIFEVRNTKMNSRERFKLDAKNNLNEKEVLSSFMKQYYLNKNNVPSKIMIPYEIEDKELLEKVLSENMGYNIEIRNPKIGEKLRFVEMAEKNAKLALKEPEKQIEIMLELQDICNLEDMPKRIEIYDISNISGTSTVSAMVVAENGKINKKSSRRFNLSHLTTPDDVKAMKETILRRMKHTLDGKKGLGEFPDLIIVDGGKGQITGVNDALNSLNLEIPVYGLVKDENHKTRALISNCGKEHKVSEKLYLFLTNFQDTVHETAINYHRKIRDKGITKSVLDNIKGVGPVIKRELLTKFKTIDNIRKASIEDIKETKSVSEKLAKKIKSELNKKQN